MSEGDKVKVLVACEFSQVVCKAFRDKGHEAYSCDILPTEGNPEWHIQDDVRNHLKGLKCSVCNGKGELWRPFEKLIIPCYGCNGKGFKEWDMLIAHDPCTYQCNSGVRWLWEIPGRWSLLEESCELTKLILNANIPKISRENPIPHKYAVKLIGADYTQCIQPHWFIGSNESKATCLWLKGLPNLERTQWLDKSQIKQSVFRMPPSENRGLERSRFPVSISKAMAEQWG